MGDTFSSGARVVVFSRDPDLGPAESASGASGGWSVLRVRSAYEAAAELLGAPAVALVIDLRGMSARHVGLLEIARRQGVEMLALGAVPASLSSEDLSGVRLIARADLDGALSRLVGGEPAPARPQPRAEPPALQHGVPPADAGRYLPEPPAANEGEPPKPKPEPEKAAEKTTRKRTTRKKTSRAKKASRPKAGTAGDEAAEPQTLLTPEELAALLGDQP